MSTISNVLEENISINILDPNLPSLASEAAIDIDNMLAKRTKDFDSIRKLASMLKNSINQSNEDQIQRMDFATSSIINEVVTKTFIEKNNVHIDEQLFDSSVLEISEILLKEDPLIDEEKLKKAMAFCLALSKAILSYKKSIRELRPQHPFRK